MTYSSIRSTILLEISRINIRVFQNAANLLQNILGRNIRTGLISPRSLLELERREKSKSTNADVVSPVSVALGAYSRVLSRERSSKAGCFSTSFSLCQLYVYVYIYIISCACEVLKLVFAVILAVLAETARNTYYHIHPSIQYIYICISTYVYWYYPKFVGSCFASTSPGRG